MWSFMAGMVVGGVLVFLGGLWMLYKLLSGMFKHW